MKIGPLEPEVVRTVAADPDRRDEALGSGFWGLGFGVWGLGFRVEILFRF